MVKFANKRAFVGDLSDVQLPVCEEKGRTGLTPRPVRRVSGPMFVTVILSIGNFSEDNHDLSDSLFFVPFLLGLICAVGPFLILFNGGTASLLGAVWLFADIMIIRLRGLVV